MKKIFGNLCFLLIAAGIFCFLVDGNLTAATTKQYRKITLPEDKKEIAMKDLFAWCIIPYDSMNRTPEQRIEMLKELGFTSYAYDWREKHLTETAHELRLAKEYGIKINAVWIWIDARSDKPGMLSGANEKILNALKETGTSTQLWLGFSEDYFEGLKQEEAVSKGIEMLEYLSERAKESGSKIALYNHGGWFGEPENQVELIKGLPECEIGIIYNFHHGHSHISRFSKLVKLIMPYLWAVNLNGMKEEGPKIITVGKGTKEKDMILMLLDAGFKGPFGIIGHTENDDVKEVLKRNLEGLRSLGL